MYKLAQIAPENYSQYVGLLTETDKDLLIGQWYMDDSYFNPIQDNDDVCLAGAASMGKSFPVGLWIYLDWCAAPHCTSSWVATTTTTLI